MHSVYRLAAVIRRKATPFPKIFLNSLSTKSTTNGDGECNHAWETACLPEDRASWETDVNFLSVDSPEVDSGLWMKGIEKQQEAKLGDSVDDIDRSLDSCSEIFYIVNNDLDNSKVSSSSEFKKADGRETKYEEQDVKIILLLKSCQQISEISQIHGFMVKTGIDNDSFATSKLLASSIQDVKHAASIFHHIQSPNLFMFNTMLRAYFISNDPKHAFAVFCNLRSQGIALDQFSFISILKVCTRELAVKKGQGIHGVVIKSGHLLFVNVKNTLLHFYSVCCRIGDAHKLFDEIPLQNDSISWNSLMGAYLRASQPAETVELFRQMFGCGLRVSAATLLNVLSAFADLGDSLGGQLIHGYCIKFGFCSNTNVVTALIEMYAKTRHIISGRRIFDGVAEKDVIIWNCMIDMYARLGLVEPAVALLRLMKLQGAKSNSSTLAGLLSACASSGLIKLGWCLSEYVEKEGLEMDAVLGTAFVDMFAKCGFLDKAIQVFESTESKDVKSWTAMILGYGVHGRARNAVDLFYRMEEEGFKPNGVTFLGVLSACSHGGLVMEAMKCFEKMVKVYGISPKIEHYGCVIDMLGRAGLLEEAHELIKRLPLRSDATAWRSLLAGCRVYGNVGVGECARRMLIEIDDQHPSDSILLSNIYSSIGNGSILWEKKEKSISSNPVGNKERKVKETGCSTIEIDNIYDGAWLEKKGTQTTNVKIDTFASTVNALIACQRPKTRLRSIS